MVGHRHPWRAARALLGSTQVRRAGDGRSLLPAATREDLGCRGQRAGSRSSGSRPHSRGPGGSQQDSVGWGRGLAVTGEPHWGQGGAMSQSSGEAGAVEVCESRVRGLGREPVVLFEEEQRAVPWLWWPGHVRCDQS